MHYPVSSITSIIFFSSISLGFIHFIIKKRQLMISIGTRFLFICLLLISMRLLIPIELPFSQNILISNVLPEVYLLLARPLPFLTNMTVQVMLAYIGLAGTIIALLHVICSYGKLKKLIHSLDCISDYRIDKTLADIMSNYSYKRKVPFKIVKTDLTSTPVIFGIFKPYIVIPDIAFSDQDLYYILSHETAHYYRGDLFFKFAVEIFHAIYWWNPIVIVLKRHMSSLMEINIDKKVTANMNELHTLNYLSCLIKTTKNQRKKSVGEQWFTAFNFGTPLSASKRIDLVLAKRKMNDKKAAIVRSMLVLFLSFLIIFLPNFFIIEPYGVSDKVEKETFTINEENAYFISNPDGSYDIYLNNNYQTTVETIFDENIPIYQSTEEVLKND